MWGQASAASMLLVSRPMTATSSVSQSMLPPVGITTSVSGPVKLDAYLVNTGGRWVGDSKPDSAAWAW